MSMLIGPLKLSTPIAAFNGGLIVEPDMTVIDQKVVPEPLVGPTVALMESFGLGAWIYRGAEWYVRDLTGSHVAREAATVQFQPTLVETFAGLDRGVAKIVGVSDDLDAMGNASTDVQRAAVKVTTTNQDEGFSNAVERFILPSRAR
jgi:hypothetical protein